MLRNFGINIGMEYKEKFANPINDCLSRKSVIFFVFFSFSNIEQQLQK